MTSGGIDLQCMGLVSLSDFRSVRFIRPSDFECMSFVGCVKGSGVYTCSTEASQLQGHRYPRLCVCLFVCLFVWVF